MKKRLTILLAMLIAVTAALAAVTFTWSSTYDNVTHYRFQFNTDKADNWIVVGPYDTKRSYELPPGTKLYVQQSLDGGKTWSRSGVGVYDPATAEPWITDAPQPQPQYVQPAAPHEQYPAPMVNTGGMPTSQAIPVVREDSLDELAPFINREEAAEKTTVGTFNKGVKRTPRFALTFKIPSVAMDPLSKVPFDWDQYAGVQMKFKNIVSVNSVFGLHLAIDLDFGMLSENRFPENPWTETEKSLGLDLGLYMSFLVGRKIDVFTGPAFGVDMLMYPVGGAKPVDTCWELPGTIRPHELFHIPEFRLGCALFAAYDLGFEYNFNSVFAAGITARYKYWFSSFKDWENNRMSVGANVGFTFSF